MKCCRAFRSGSGSPNCRRWGIRFIRAWPAIRRACRALDTLRARKPVIAAINGPRVASACSPSGPPRFAGSKAHHLAAQRGVAEHGISWLLPRLIGPAQALDLPRASSVRGGGAHRPGQQSLPQEISSGLAHTRHAHAIRVAALDCGKRLEGPAPGWRCAGCR
jgi:hypothetical protein